MAFFQENDNKKISVVQVYKCVKEGNGIKVFTSIPNQGSISEYITKKQAMGKTLTEKNFIGQLENFIESMRYIQ